MVKAAVVAADAAKRQTAKADALTVGEVWTAYLQERRPHWGELHYRDHERLCKAGGETAQRGTRGRGVTIAGPLHPLTALTLRDLTAPVIEAWAANKAKTRPTSARLAWRLLKVFLTWCSEQPAYAGLLSTLPRRNEWIFSSPTSKAGHLSEPSYPHSEACKAAGLEGLTLHGLRRSFKSLTEWLEIAAGVAAQLIGHKPSATAERHYTVRPLELLRVHHEKIEAWILEQAGVTFDAQGEPGKLRVV